MQISEELPGVEMQQHNNIALKEWAVVCSALADGTQKILFRKGGIHEGPEGFQPEHEEFWLYPTGFHQSLSGVRSPFVEAAQAVLERPRAPQLLEFQRYCLVQSVYWVEDESRLPKLERFHVLSDEAVRKRFFYRQPGLFVLLVETFELAAPLTTPHLPEYDGCHSWVQLQQELSTTGVQRTSKETTRVKAELDQLLGKGRD